MVILNILYSWISVLFKNIYVIYVTFYSTISWFLLQNSILVTHSDYISHVSRFFIRFAWIIDYIKVTIYSLHPLQRRRILDTIADMHKNNRLLASTHKLQNRCLEVILANKKAFCLLAAQTETNPMDKLCKLQTTKLLFLKVFQWK